MFENFLARVLYISTLGVTSNTKSFDTTSFMMASNSMINIRNNSSMNPSNNNSNNNNSNNNFNNNNNNNININVQGIPNLQLSMEDIARLDTLAQDTERFIGEARSKKSLSSLKTISTDFKNFIGKLRSRRAIESNVNEKELRLWFAAKEMWNPPGDLFRDAFTAQFIKYQYQIRVANKHLKFRSYFRSIQYWLSCVIYDRQLAKDLGNCMPFIKTQKALRAVKISKENTKSIKQKQLNLKILLRWQCINFGYKLVVKLFIIHLHWQCDMHLICNTWEH